MSSAEERLQEDKPHRGRLEQWVKVHHGSCVFHCEGIFIGHPDFHGTYGWTSVVLKEDGNEIVTLNSRYTLGAPKAVLSEAGLEALVDAIGEGRGPKITTK